MADQATLRRFNSTTTKGPGTAHSSSTGQNSGDGRTTGSNEADLSASSVVSNVAGFGENLLTLAELQSRLTAVELRQNFESMKIGGTLMIAGMILAISTLPVLMTAAAELMVSELGMKRGYALLIAAAAMIAIAGSCIAIARRWLSRNPLGFPVASEEFARNMNWMRTILRHSGRWPLNR
jgi:hypothetical protein